MDRKDSIVEFLTGKFSGKVLRLYTFIMAGIFGGLIAGAIAAYQDYNFLTLSISSLGALDKNPGGWWLFSTAMWGMAFMIIPFFMHAKRIFAKYTPRSARLFQICVLITAIGMAVLGFFPEMQGTDVVHYIAAGFIFVGFFIDASISWISLLRMGRTASTRERKRMVFTILALMVIAFWSVLISMLGVYIIQGRAVFLVQMYFWEWIYVVVSIGLYLLLLEIVVSREPEA